MATPPRGDDATARRVVARRVRARAGAASGETRGRLLRDAASCLERAAAYAEEETDARVADAAWPARKADRAQLLFNSGAARARGGDDAGAEEQFAAAGEAWRLLGKTKAMGVAIDQASLVRERRLKDEAEAAAEQ